MTDDRERLRIEVAKALEGRWIDVPSGYMTAEIDRANAESLADALLPLFEPHLAALERVRALAAELEDPRAEGAIRTEAAAVSYIRAALDGTETRRAEERETVEQMAARTGLPVELLSARVVFRPEADRG